VQITPPTKIYQVIPKKATILKSVRLKKLFRVRRKNLNLFKDNLGPIRIPTLLETMFKEYDSNETFKIKATFFCFRFFMRFKKSYLSNFTITEEREFTLTYDDYIKKNLMYINYFKRNWKRVYNNTAADLVSGIFINTPKQQVFMTLFKQRLLFTISAGFIRILVKFEKKCYKKRKVVVLNTIRLFLKMVFLSKLPKPTFVRISRCVTTLPTIISEFKKSKFNKRVHYFIFEPKLNFGTLNRQRKSAIKKKIKKNKLPSVEQF
jgi:hypothetical protein